MLLLTPTTASAAGSVAKEGSTACPPPQRTANLTLRASSEWIPERLRSVLIAQTPK